MLAEFNEQDGFEIPDDKTSDCMEMIFLAPNRTSNVLPGAG
jgi:hypothetical protein